jgi:hypothetical protein
VVYFLEEQPPDLFGKWFYWPNPLQKVGYKAFRPLITFILDEITLLTAGCIYNHAGSVFLGDIPFTVPQQVDVLEKQNKRNGHHRKIDARYKT